MSLNKTKTLIRQLDLATECAVKGSDIAQSMYLQTSVLNALESQGKHGYIIEKSVQRVTHYMQNHYVFGIFEQKETQINQQTVYIEELVAQVTLYVPKVDETFESDIEDFERFNLNPFEIAMIKGLEVCTKQQGKGYGKLLIDFVHTIAKEQNRKHIITDIAFENLASLGAFMHSGYSLVDVFHPVGDVPLAIVYYNLEQAISYEKEDYVEVTANAYSDMSYFIRNGLFAEKLERVDNVSIYKLKHSKMLSGLFAKSHAEVA